MPPQSDLFKPDGKGQTPLHTVKDAAALEALMVDPAFKPEMLNHEDNYGWTPFLRAAESRQLSITATDPR